MDPTASQPRSPPVQRSTRLAKELRWSRIAFVVSIVLHLLVLFFFPPFSQPLANPQLGVRDPSIEPEDFGLEVLLLPGMEIRNEVVGRPSAPEPGSTAATPIIVISPAQSAGEGEVPAEERGDDPDPLPSVAERLRPQMVDPRLWAPVELLGGGLTEEERAELLLNGMIRSWNDSMAIALALSERATDWTYTDAEGRRWGLSPGRLHLGDFSIPLPFSFGGSMEQTMLRRRELEEQEWIRQDLQRARIQGEIQEIWVERARAIRERMEAERQEAREGAEAEP